MSAFYQPQLDWMHYVDYPFEVDGGTCNDDVFNSEVNILVALRSHWQTIANGNVDAWTRGVALRYLLHMVADLHQPLHTVSRCTPQTPQGDEGGNGFPLRAGSSAGDVSNLHSMWDSMGGAYRTTIEAVVASDGTTSRGCAPRLACEEIEQLRLSLVRAEAAELLAGHSDEAIAASAGELWYRNAPNPPLDAMVDRTSVTLTRADLHSPGIAAETEDDPFESWAKESYRFVRRNALYNLTSGSMPSEEYVQFVQAEAKRRVVIGGVRLGLVLEAAIAASKRTTAQAVAVAPGNSAPQANAGDLTSLMHVVVAAMIMAAATGALVCFLRRRRAKPRPKLRIYSTVASRESEYYE
eukprot:COSAG02_NODE_9689_length_2140_cov_2.167565_2_plen_353_part_00